MYGYKGGLRNMRQKFKTNCENSQVICIIYFTYMALHYKNVESNTEQVLATTPHEMPTVRPPTSHHENYTGQTSQTRRTLLEKQRRAHK